MKRAEFIYLSQEDILDMNLPLKEVIHLVERGLTAPSREPHEIKHACPLDVSLDFLKGYESDIIMEQLKGLETSVLFLTRIRDSLRRRLWTLLPALLNC